MADTQTTALSLFSGVGGLDLGWELATTGRVVGYCERDAFAAAILVARMEDAALAPAPIWAGNVEELDLAPFLGVEWVIGGFPCQDISVAGKGGGIDGERSGLWSELLRAYRDSGARYLFAENVAAITVRGLDRVIGDLAEIGCTARWLCVRASDVGAPHQRNRWFLLADRVANANGAGQCASEGPIREPEQRNDTGGSDSDVADTASGGLGEHRRASWSRGHTERRGEFMEHADIQHDNGPRQQRARWWGQLANDCDQLGNAERDRRRFSWRPTTEKFNERCERPFPPGPGDSSRWAHYADSHPHLAPAIEPGLCVLVDGVATVVDASRADQLRAVGNGVVALQAALALRELLRWINTQQR